MARYLRGVSEVTAVVWGGWAASTPNWQKSYAAWSFTRALSVLFGRAYITVVI